MSTRGRMTELQKLFSKISGGGNCFSQKELVRILGRRVSGLPSVVYEQDFIDAYLAETERLQELDEKLREVTEKYALKRDLHGEFYRLKSSHNEKGVSKLDVVVEAASDLPQSDVFFHIKKNDVVLYKSMVKTKTVNPVWNERYTVGVEESDVVTIEILASKTEKVIGLVDVPLKTLEDQMVHHRVYEMKNGTITVRLQWVYNEITFHKMYADTYTHLGLEEEALLERVSNKLNGMFTLDGDALLESWFCEESTERNTFHSRYSLHCESLAQTTVVSLVNTPNTSTVASRYSRPVDLSEIIPKRSKTNFKSLTRSGLNNFFCLGLARYLGSSNT